MMVLHERAVLDDELNRLHLREITMLGASVRVADELRERMVILDERVAVVPLDPADSSRGALVVRHPGIVVGLLDLFRRTWDKADEVPWAAPAARRVASPSEREIELLALLATGVTDETAARESGTSVRHLRRRVAKLMADLGARSRFEAGVEATRRGWL